MYGYTDDHSQDLVQKNNYGKFGLNKGKLLKFEYNPNSGKGGTAADAIDVEISIQDSPQRLRLFPVSRVYAAGKEITDKNSEAYKTAFLRESKMFNATITHILKTAFSDAELQTLLGSKSFTTFKEFATYVSSLMAPKIGAGILVDVFLQYQYKLASDAKMTYLEIPRNLSFGSFLVKHIEPVAAWTEESSWMDAGEMKVGLRYIDGNNNIHPFTRDEYFMGTNYAKQQKGAGSTSSKGKTSMGEMYSSPAGNDAW